MSTGTYIEIIPNEQLLQIEANLELVEALEQLARSSNLYGFYHLKDGDDDEKEEYFENIEDLDIEVVNKLEMILRQAKQSLSIADMETMSSGFESTYDLHEQALPKALTQQNIDDVDKIVETLLRAEEWSVSDSIRILSHQKCIELDAVLKSIDVSIFQSFYHWKNHEPIAEWQQEVFDEIVSLLKIIHYAANNNASLLYLYG